MNLTMHNLEKCFEAGIEKNANFIAIRVSCVDMPEDELIINPIENAEDKLEYYKKAYSDDLTLKAAPQTISITGFTYGDTLGDIEEDLL